MSSDPDKRIEKNPDEKPKKEKKRKLWLYRRKDISVDDEFVSCKQDGDTIRIPLDSKFLRTPQYRKWLVDSGYWIPSMDLRESFITIDLEEYTVEDEEEVGGGEQTESLEERMKKLKTQQQGKFKKYYERKAVRQKNKKSRNSKSKVKKSKIEVKTQKVETVKKEKPKPQEGAVEKVNRVDPSESQDPKKPEKASNSEAREEKIKRQDPPKSEDPKAQNKQKPEDPLIKERVRSHYCYTEMHLASGKEIKKKK